MNMIQRLTEITELPTLPEIALRIRSLIMSDEGNASMLARLIEQDPSISAKILKVANSSFYCSANNRITSVKTAITRIGFNEIGHIALAVSLIRTFSRKSNVLDYKQFWKHSLTAAYLTSLVAETGNEGFSPRERHALFLSGLFHDIGILVYDQFFHQQFEQIIEHAFKQEISFLDAERDLYPSETHVALGAALLELWKIDLPVISGIRFHHNIEKAPVNLRPVAAATYLSEYILCNSGLGSFEGLIRNGNKNIISFLKLTKEMLNNYITLAEYEVERSDLILALETDSPVFQLRAV